MRFGTILGFYSCCTTGSFNSDGEVDNSVVTIKTCDYILCDVIPSSGIFFIFSHYEQNI